MVAVFATVVTTDCFILFSRPTPTPRLWLTTKAWPSLQVRAVIIAYSTAYTRPMPSLPPPTHTRTSHLPTAGLSASPGFDVHRMDMADGQLKQSGHGGTVAGQLRFGMGLCVPPVPAASNDVIGVIAGQGPTGDPEGVLPR